MGQMEVAVQSAAVKLAADRPAFQISRQIFFGEKNHALVIIMSVH